VLEDKSKKKLVDMTLSSFMNETASESPAPGGGSISAYVGSLGVSLATMVANLSSHKRGWDSKWEEFSDWANRGKQIQEALLKLVDEDTNAFNKIMNAFSLPKKSDEDKQTRKQAIQDATKYAIEIPFKTMQLAFESMEVIRAMAEIGNPNSVTDAGVGALCARTAVMGAFLNVKINSKDLEDINFVDDIISKAKLIEIRTQELESEILEIVNWKI
jgi:glutamate formiminotransferase/formiminotetrahydrofolate cyclodeaminase